MRTLIAAALAVAGLTLAPYALAAHHTLSVTLHEQNKSGESGKAELIAKGAKTEVVLHMAHAGTVPQPAHIHAGTCAKLDPKPAFQLKPVEHGKSVTVVDVSLENCWPANTRSTSTRAPRKSRIPWPAATSPNDLKHAAKPLRGAHHIPRKASRTARA